MAPSDPGEGTPLVSDSQASATPLDSELHIGPASDWSGDGDGGAGDSGHASGDRPSRWRRRWRWLAAPAVLATLAVVTSRSAGSRTSRQRPLQQSQQRDATTAAALAADVMVDDDDMSNRIFYFTAGKMLDDACLYRDRTRSTAAKAHVEVFAAGSGSVEDCSIDDAGIVYFTDKRQGVLKVSPDGGTTDSLANLNTTGEPKGMARCDELSLVLWVSSDGCVYRTRTSKSRDQGAAPTPVERIISNLTAPFDVAVAPTIGRLFISDPGAGVIFVSDMEGGDLSVWARVDDVHGLDVVEVTIGALPLLGGARPSYHPFSPS